MTRTLWINQVVRFYREAVKGRMLAYIRTQGRTKKEVWAERMTTKEIEDVQKECGKECERKGEEKSTVEQGKGKHRLESMMNE